LKSRKEFLISTETKERFIKYLDDRTADVNKRILQLTEDSRKDEADFEKIRANIFQIIKTIFRSSCQRSSNEAEQLKFLNHNLTAIADTWQNALTNAENHHDEKRVLQEKIKLEAMQEARDVFEQLYREEKA